MAWYFVPIAILLVIGLIVAGSWLLPLVLKPQLSSTLPPSGSGVRISLCSALNGSDCGGNHLVLPHQFQGATFNATGCDSFAGWGPNERLWINYTTSGPVYGIVLPSHVFGGIGGWLLDASSLLTNSTAVGSALWYSGFVGGTNSASVPVPNDGATYCLGWYNPSVSLTVGWNSDIAVTYAQP